MSGGSSGEVKQIFLSHCVESMGVHALALNERLRASGYSTFVCTTMSAGQQFRREITVNAANCKVMVVFMDDRWAASKECLSEFNCAYCCFNKSQTPRIVPVVLDGFSWIDPWKFPEAHCITANFHCLQKGRNQSWEEVMRSVIKKVDAIMAELAESGAAGLNAAATENPDNSLFLEFVTCEICQEVFKQPKILPCSHSFCKQCLVDWKKSSGGYSFPCPKCRIPFSGKIEDLTTDFRANQLIDAMNSREMVTKTQQVSLNQSPSKPAISDTPADQMVNPEYECEPVLVEWFNKNKIPKEVIDILLDNGFEFLDILLEMTDSDLKELGLKAGHERKLSKCIKQHNTLTETTLTRPSARPPSAIKRTSNKKEAAEMPTVPETVPDVLSNWGMIEGLYDDRVLCSGTSPADSLKFWSSLSRIRFENIIESIKQQAEAVVQHQRMADGLKAKCLQQAAMVLCDAGSYAHAVDFAKRALELEKSVEREFEIKALLVYSTHHKLKQPMWVSETKDPRVYSQLVDLCNDVIAHKQHVASKAKLCKVHILKSFTLQALVSRDRSNLEAGNQAKVTLKEAYALCDELGDNGLRAEATMTEGLLIASLQRSRASGDSLKLLLKARTLCQQVYGEFSTLMARIYYNIGIDYEVNRKLKEAYECFRRTWLIDRQIKGPHHPSTRKSGSVLDDDYVTEAESLGDALPRDERDEKSASMTPNERDRNFKERIKFLDTATESPNKKK